MNIELNGITYERRFLDSWNYNAALIFDELETIVLSNGGAIVSTWAKARKAYAITNRSITDAIREQNERIERYRKVNSVAFTAARAAAIAAAKEKLHELENIPNEPRITYYGDYRYICFALNGSYYYYSVDNNPFFDFHFAKAKIQNGEINKHYYLNNDKKDWFYDCFWRWNCSRDDIQDAAKHIFDMLINSADTRQHGKPSLEKLIILAGNMEALTNE